MSLHNACMLGHVSVVQDLIRAGCDVEDREDLGLTPLAVACTYSKLDVVILLIDEGASVFARSKFGADVLSLTRFDPIKFEVGRVMLWRSDFAAQDVKWDATSAERNELVWTRRVRDLLAPLVNPHRKMERRTMYKTSILRVLPWHVRVNVLRFVVLGPIERSWGREEVI